MAMDLDFKQICDPMKSKKALNSTSTSNPNQVSSNSSEAANSNIVSNPKIYIYKSGTQKNVSSAFSSSSTSNVGTAIVSNPDETMESAKDTSLVTDAAKDISITEAVFDVCNQLVNTVSNIPKIICKRRASADYSSEMFSLESQPECIFVDGSTLDEAEYRITRENIEVLKDWRKLIANIDIGSKHPEKGKTKSESSTKRLASENISEIPSPNSKKRFEPKYLVSENVSETPSPNNEKKFIPSKSSCAEKDDGIINSLNLTNDVLNGKDAGQLNSSRESLNVGETLKSRKKKFKTSSRSRIRGQSGSKQVDEICSNGETHSTLDGVKKRKLSITRDSHVEILHSKIPTVDLSRDKEEIQKYIVKLSNTSHVDVSKSEMPSLAGGNGKPFVADVTSEERTQKSNFDLNDDPPMPILTERYSIPQGFKKRKRNSKSNVTTQQKLLKLETTVVDNGYSDCFSKAKEVCKMSLTETNPQEDGIDRIHSYANESTEITDSLILDGANEKESNAEIEIREAFSENNIETIASENKKHEMEMLKTLDESSFLKNKFIDSNVLKCSQEISTPEKISSQFYFNLSISKYSKRKTTQNRKIKMYFKLKQQRMKGEYKDTCSKTNREHLNKLENICSVSHRSVKGDNTCTKKFSKNPKILKRKNKNIVLISQSTQTNEQNSISMEISPDPPFISPDSLSPSLVKDSDTSNPWLKLCTDCEKRKNMTIWNLHKNRIVYCPECEINKLCMMIISKMEKVYECGKQKANYLDDETWQLLETAINYSKYLKHFCQLCNVTLTDLQFSESFNNLKLLLSSDNVISVPSKDNVNSVPSIDNIQSASDIPNVKSFSNTNYVHSALSANNVKSHPIEENVKSQLSTDNLDAHQSADSVKPPQTTDTVKPPQSTDTVKPPPSSDSVKPPLSSENLKPTLSLENLKPPTIKHSVRPLWNTDSETRKEENGVSLSIKNKKPEKTLSVTEIIDSDEDCVVIEVLHSSPSKNSILKKKNTFQDHLAAGSSNGLHNISFPNRNLNLMHDQQSNGRWISNQLPNGQLIHNSNMFASQVPNEPHHFNVRNGIGSGGRIFVEQPPGTLRNESNSMANMLGSTSLINRVFDSPNGYNSMRNVNHEYKDQWSQRSQQSYRDSELFLQRNRDFDIRFDNPQAPPFWKVNESFPNFTNIDSSRRPARYNYMSNNFDPAMVNVNNYYDLTEGNTLPSDRKAEATNHDFFMSDNTYKQILLNASHRGTKLQKNFPPFIPTRQISMTGNIGSSMINTNNSGSSAAGMIPPPKEMVNLVPMNSNPSHKRFSMADNVLNVGNCLEEGLLNNGFIGEPAGHKKMPANIDLSVLNANYSRVSIEAKTPPLLEHAAYDRHMDDEGKRILEKGITKIRRESSRKNPAPIRKRVRNDQNHIIPKNSIIQNPGSSDNATIHIPGSLDYTTTQNPGSSNYTTIHNTVSSDSITIQNPGSSDNTIIQNPGSSIPQNNNASPTVGVPVTILDSMVPDVTVAERSKHREASYNFTSPYSRCQLCSNY